MWMSFIALSASVAGSIATSFNDLRQILKVGVCLGIMYGTDRDTW